MMSNTGNVKLPATLGDSDDVMLGFTSISAPNPKAPERLQRIRIKNRRKRYLDTHPEYFSPSLELAGLPIASCSGSYALRSYQAPLLYDRLIRRFQSPTERESEGRSKGYSGVLEADIWRSEAKIEALAKPDRSLALIYKRGPNGEIIAEDPDEIPMDKEDGKRIWRDAMEQRFVGGEDEDFQYTTVDDSETYDDRGIEEREEEEKYFAEEQPEWVLDGAGVGHGDEPTKLEGETGVQDF